MSRVLHQGLKFTCIKSLSLLVIYFRVDLRKIQEGRDPGGGVACASPPRRQEGPGGARCAAPELQPSLPLPFLLYVLKRPINHGSTVSPALILNVK